MGGFHALLMACRVRCWIEGIEAALSPRMRWTRSLVCLLVERSSTVWMFIDLRISQTNSPTTSNSSCPGARARSWMRQLLGQMLFIFMDGGTCSTTMQYALHTDMVLLS